MKVQTALMSVSDREGLEEFAGSLKTLGVRLIGTEGTARFLTSKGVQAESLADLYRAPESMDGRVKSLHPSVYAGILADRSNVKHMREAEEGGIVLIDLVVVNLYPFERVIRDREHTIGQAIENIDIGGVSLIRAGAKNHAHVGVVVDPADYREVAAELRAKGGMSEETRRRLAVKAFGLTARYDQMIAEYLGGRDGFPETLPLCLTKVSDLRYGENPHQKAAFYRLPTRTGPGVAHADQLSGEELSFNNLQDADAAFELVREFEDPASVIVKHASPCGAAVADSLVEAFGRAKEGDPRSAFGGILAFNGPVDEDVAKAVARKENFFEVLIAPEVTETALGILRGGTRWGPRLRVLRVRPVERSVGWSLRGVRDGLLVQTEDDADLKKFEVVVGTIGKEEETDLFFAWKIVKHARSNAVVLVKAGRLVGVGQGQTSRVGACALAVQQAKGRAKGAVAASDAFFPFPDGIEVLAKAGVRAVIHPGGSIRDKEVHAAAEKMGVKVVLTGMRHFRH